MISIAILLIFVVIELILSADNFRVTDNSLIVLGYIAIIQYIFSVYSWKRNNQQIISPYVILLTAIYIFQCGQIALFALPLDYTPTLIGHLGITLSDIYNSTTYTLILVAFFHIGALWQLIKNPIAKNSFRTYNNDDDKQLRVIRNVALVVFAISILPYYYTLIDNAVKSMTTGYGTLYEDESAVGFGHLSESIGGYYIPSYLCLLIGCMKMKKERYLLYVLGIINCIVILMTGSRTYAVLIIAALIIYQNYFVNRFSKKQLLILCLAGIAFLNVLTIIKDTRGSHNRNIETYLTHESEESGVIDAISEMGSSQTCTAKMMEIVPSREDWFYGKTYLYAVLSLIPNLGFWDHHPSRDYGMTDIWLTEQLGLNYGVGSSMAAEAYLNFGYLGFVIFLLYGYFAATIFGRLRGYINRHNYINSAVVLMIFWFCLSFPRFPFMTTFRGVIFYALPIYLAIRYLYKNYKIKRHRLLRHKTANIIKSHSLKDCPN